MDKRVKNNKIDNNKIKDILSIFASISAILGISLLAILGPLKNDIPYFNEKTYESEIEKIKITQSEEYIISILGVPISKNCIDLLVEDDLTIKVTKEIYITDYYTFIAYFDSNTSLIGYIIISNKDDFSPRLFRNEKCFSKTFNKSEIPKYGYLYLSLFNYSQRVDNSSFYLEYYYHHLATNNCLIGIGISDLGYLTSENINFLTNNIGTKDFYFYSDEDFENCHERSNQFLYNVPNVFSVFLYDEKNINTINLIREEFSNGISINNLEYRRLVE